MFAFGKEPNGNLRFRSKGVELHPGNTDKLFTPAVTHVLKVADKIPNGTVFYGETLAKNKHNTLSYNRPPINHIALFGMSDYAGTNFQPFSALEEWAKELEIETVPLIAKGVKLDSMEDFVKLLDRESHFGGVKVEGIVVKNYDMHINFNNVLFPFAALKLVSDAFKEKNSKAWSGETNKFEALLDQYRTEARWAKAVQHLWENGELVNEPKDIGPLMKELARDLEEEEAANFKEELFKFYRKIWIHNAQRGFPEWYKQRLLELSE